MSGVIAPDAFDVATGLLLDVGWKVTVPLALGLAASALPGSAAARHLRLTLGLAATPALALATVLHRGADAAWGTDLPAWPVAVWVIGALVSVGGLARGLWELRALPTTRTPEGWERCARLSSPMTAGWWRPRLLVPDGFHAWPAEARAAALAHERAHVRRSDWLVHVLAWGLHAALWFHPLLPPIRRRLALLAECAADDAVLAEGHDATAYAELLLRLGRSGPVAGLTLGRSFVGVRVRRLVTAAPPRRGSVPTAAVVALLLAGSAWTAGAAAWHAPEPVLGCRPAGPAPILLPVRPHPVYWSPEWSPSSWPPSDAAPSPR